MAGDDRADGDRRREFAGFLSSRRSRVRPGDVGLPPTVRRRVPGLRRDEVARLAGMSVEYYTRLEQGRGGRPSDEVLDALARALRLDPAERDHLFHLSASPRPSVGQATDAPLRSGIAALLATMSHTPVLVHNRRLDVLATNRLGSLLVPNQTGTTGAGFRNCARATFLDPDMRHVYVEWDQVARDVVGLLRRFSGERPHDRAIHQLVEELLVRSEEFRAMWRTHDVRRRLHGRKRLRHPVVGEMTLDYEHLFLPDDPDLAFTVFTAPEGTAARRALDRLRRLPDDGAAVAR